MDLLKNNADYDSGHYDNIDEFKFFVQNLKNDSAPVEPLSKEELSHFIFSKNDIKNKYVRGAYYDPQLEKIISSTKLPYKAYIFPVIKDEFDNTLPAYLALYETYSALDNKLNDIFEDIPNQQQTDVVSELKLMKEIYANQNIFCFDSVSEKLLNNLWYLFNEYIYKFRVNFESFNTNYKNLLGIKDFGLRLSYKYILLSFAKDLEANKMATLCPYCSKLFAYKTRRIYCSEKCKVNASNKRQYQKKLKSK